jgi:zinc/manganese transport system permease protein
MLSYHASLPTGPAMILTLGAIFIASVIVGPAGGLIAQSRAGRHRTG